MDPKRPTPTPPQQDPPSTRATLPPSDFGRLQDLIVRPESSSTDDDDSLTTQLWSAEVSDDDLMYLRIMAQSELVRAIGSRIRVLREEVAKLERLMPKEGGQTTWRKDTDRVRGDICALVLQRWGVEKDS
ncbi:hypothetical protein LTR91_005616 [Friedmanniomyces endolithicus]|uniref:Uncharacterized protein n=1 Tax=Friedmanniomyces endolithicus TaxID=329885 RepID=A0AAN6KTJ1_9PEZI|nr:hypothetical protein LTR38_009343 [Friedmanniomyces endolithicus]KAK0809015.1 hypothetical protein LTR59_002719 [Friedmanniomyces endolithicus]KAK0850261.1 hypothetical protein LTR03_004723 [Friedmanniomyces endolithicus]KAK0876750.1 hypothetical protein LTR87_009432 [Friedmanniomyces endolithicus]KAK1000698.1 hypothetical protein LTR91_005616 [Friedmanniomyces endolithicus]